MKELNEFRSRYRKLVGVLTAVEFAELEYMYHREMADHYEERGLKQMIDYHKQRADVHYNVILNASQIDTSHKLWYWNRRYGK
jgi:hypothetical protein